MYTLTANPNSIRRDSDNAFIPTVEGNRDYDEYLRWVADGNVPNPYIDPPKPIPTTVSAYQAKMQLVRAGLYSAVETAIQTSGNMELTVAWNNATSFDRNSTFIQALAPALNLSEQDLDDLFLAASEIT